MSSTEQKSDQSSPLQSPGSTSQLSPGADAAQLKKELKEKEKERHHLRTNVNEALLGAHSPASIPSSPASIRSISSAIFERDIEPSHLSPLSPQHSADPHRIPRARSTEQLENAVPSVLDSAAAVLASIKDEGEVEVVSPDSAAARSFGLGLRSRSPSPSPAAMGVSPHVLSSPGIATKSSTASLSPALSPSPTTSSSSTSPSQKRLSFISYSDLLSSTPATSHSLTHLTSSPPEPPHIPTVNTITNVVLTPSGSRAPSIRGRKGDRGSVIVDDVGGEWEREGLGKGLEERMEEVVREGKGE